MSQLLKQILIFAILAIIFIFPGQALADVAPPLQPPITNLEPGQAATQVRMLTETVVLDIRPDSKSDNLFSGFVSAKFTMRNMGAAAETMAVRFPITANDGWGNFPEIYNIRVMVNSVQVPFQRINYPDIRYQDARVPWAEFNITFPVGKDVTIEITYTLNGSGYAPFTSFYYILETGAGWFGTIGSADVILRLPYPASTQNIILAMQIGWSETTPGGSFSGNELRWHFEDFEPGPDGPVKNMEFSLVSPVVWQEILDGRNYLDQHPADGEAWGSLAMNTKRVFFLGKGYRTDPGGEELYQLAVAAYEKCLALKPQDAQWHAGFADLLSERAYWDFWSKGVSGDAMRSIQEIQIALKLAPSDSIVLSIAENISYLFPGSLVQTNNRYDFPWLTQTPTPLPTSEMLADPATLSGEYKSGLLSLDNQKKMQMVVRLFPNYSAEFEGRYEDGTTLQASGDWVDNEDYSIQLLLKDPQDGSYRMTFMWDDKGIYAVEYPAIFSGPGYWELMRVLLETPAPPAIITVIPTQTPTIQPSTEPVQGPKQPSYSICGRTIFIPMGLVLLFVFSQNKKHKRGNQS